MSDNQAVVQISIPVFYIKDFKGNIIPTCETSTERCKFLYYGDYKTCSYLDKYPCDRYMNSKSTILTGVEVTLVARGCFYKGSERYIVNIISDPNHLNDGVHHTERKNEIVVLRYLEPCEECPLHNSKLSTFW